MRRRRPPDGGVRSIAVRERPSRRDETWVGGQAERAGFNAKVRARWFQWHAGQTSTT